MYHRLKMKQNKFQPPLQSYKRRYVACQHFPDDQTLRLQTGAGEDDIIHLPSGLDRVDCERQDEEKKKFQPASFISSDFDACSSRGSTHMLMNSSISYHFISVDNLTLRRWEWCGKRLLYEAEGIGFYMCLCQQ